MSKPFLRYARLVPRNPARGALAERISLGSALFVAGQWYTVTDKARADVLEDQEQPSSPGVALFQVLTREEYDRVTQQELQAAARAAGFTGMAAVPQQAPAPKPEGAQGPRKGAFEGFEKGVGEAPNRLGAPAAPPPAAAVAPAEDDVGETDDIDADSEGDDEGQAAEGGEAEGTMVSYKGERVALESLSKPKLVDFASIHAIDVDPKSRKNVVFDTVLEAVQRDTPADD